MVRFATRVGGATSLVGDDIKSRIGATIVHRTLPGLLGDQGVIIDHTCQFDTGGNTDLLDMLERSRLRSKKRSETESVRSQLDERLDADDIHIGRSGHLPGQDDDRFIGIDDRGRQVGSGDEDEDEAR